MSFPAARVPTVSAVVAIATILSCYVISAVFLKVVPLWLPDITHTARASPANIVFRVGMIPASTAIAFHWWIAHGWTTGKRAALGVPAAPRRAWATVGAVGGGLLIVSSSCITMHEMLWWLHVPCATGFFLLQLYSMFFATGDMRAVMREGGMTRASFYVKVACLAAAVVLLLCEIAFPLLKVPSALQNLLEWLLTVVVMTWHFSLRYDYGNTAITVALPKM